MNWQVHQLLSLLDYWTLGTCVGGGVIPTRFRISRNVKADLINSWFGFPGVWHWFWLDEQSAEVWKDLVRTKRRELFACQHGRPRASVPSLWESLMSQSDNACSVAIRYHIVSVPYLRTKVTDRVVVLGSSVSLFGFILEYPTAYQNRFSAVLVENIFALDDMPV